MSDLEIDFEELLNITVVDGFGYSWGNKVFQIQREWKFEDFAAVITMFNQWNDDRKAGLHA